MALLDALAVVPGPSGIAIVPCDAAEPEPAGEDGPGQAGPGAAESDSAAAAAAAHAPGPHQERQAESDAGAGGSDAGVGPGLGAGLGAGAGAAQGAGPRSAGKPGKYDRPEELLPELIRLVATNPNQTKKQARAACGWAGQAFRSPFRLGNGDHGACPAADVPVASSGQASPPRHAGHAA